MSMNATIERTPLVITAGDLVVGPVHAPFRDSDPQSLLHNYLVLIRQLRGQEREPRLTLRGEDISALADHLGRSESDVLGDLLDLMGATRAQRNALFALFAAGALTIIATGSVALDVPATGSTAGVIRSDAAATVVVERTIDPAVADDPVSVRPAPLAVPTVEPELPIAEGGPQWTIAVDAALRDAVPAAGEGVGIADDGSTVAVGSPPVPEVEGRGTADDGSTVAVGPPPVPPVEGEGVADDGSTVAVAPPPVPDAAGQGTADDGSTVAVGPPPVP
jgi:hypothetical protein